jgi:hypothetical protein
MRVAPWLIAGTLLGTVLAAEPAQQATPASATTRSAAQSVTDKATTSRPMPARPARPTGKKKPDVDEPIPFTTAELEKLVQIEARARERYPKRRDTPLRYMNISDNEVREIEALAASVSIPALVNISPVVTGCSCEEGADCTEQVYIVGRYKDRHIGLQLSRVKNKWNVGRVQRWWLEYAALQARETVMERTVYDEAHARKLLDFPMCVGGATGDRTATASTAPGVNAKR